MSNRLRFGVFMAPFNSPPSQNATVSLQRDIETIQLLDRLAYNEAWIGEHHSAGTEVIAEPFMFITHVGAMTRHIKLGTGVVSLPYHNPLWVADRAILADHLLRGRFMLGLGPGSLPTDAAMIGLEPAELRPALEHDIDVLLRLIRGQGPVSVETSRYRLVNAQTQLAPYSDPEFEIAVAAVASPSGPRLAGRHGLGLLSVGALVKEQFDLLHLHWDVMEAEAKLHNQIADRKRWRLVCAMHIAETREQAMEDVKYGFDAFCEYTQKTLALPTFRAVGTNLKERIDWINESGLGVIGTPEDAVRHIQTMQAQSGGFGCFMMMTHDWASWTATQRHYELFARHVVPHFQPSRARLLASEAAARSRHAELDAKNGAAIQAWAEKHAAERATAR